MQISSTKPICVTGQVFDNNTNTCAVKSIFITDGKIIRIINGPADASLLENVFLITLKADEIILPCFINLHTHIGYNILPLWQSPGFCKNRFQWRNSPDYNRDIKNFVDFIRKGWATTPLLSHYLVNSLPDRALQRINLEESRPYFELYKAAAISDIQKIHAILSEIQAVAGGTGMLLQTLDLDNEAADMKHFLIRNTGNPADMELSAAQKVYTVVDFFRPDKLPTGDPAEDTSAWAPVLQPPLNDYTTSVNNNNQPFFATVAHIGEGITGNIHSSVKDPYSAREGKALLEQLAAKANAANLPGSNLSLVHANGLDYTDKELLAFLRKNNISVIWSPVSNLLLYNDTLPVEILLNENINICLGTDWTPSGSKHILDEIKFAKFYNDHFNLGISSSEWIKMATTNPAHALGNIGYAAITEGGVADMFVIKNADPQNGLDSILKMEDKDARFCMINGRVVFGDVDIFSTMGVDYQQFPDSEGVNSKEKAISINSGLGFNLLDAIRKIDVLMNNYSDEVLQKKVYRTKFLSSDDTEYTARIQNLRNSL